VGSRREGPAGNHPRGARLRHPYPAHQANGPVAGLLHFHRGETGLEPLGPLVLLVRVALCLDGRGAGVQHGQVAVLAVLVEFGAASLVGFELRGLGLHAAPARAHPLHLSAAAGRTLLPGERSIGERLSLRSRALRHIHRPSSRSGRPGGAHHSVRLGVLAMPHSAARPHGEDSPNSEAEQRAMVTGERIVRGHAQEKGRYAQEVQQVGNRRLLDGRATAASTHLAQQPLTMA
jgi:hypothetical protein